MTGEHKTPNGVPNWLYDMLTEIKRDLKDLSGAVHKRIDTVESDAHGRITTVETSLHDTREDVAGLKVKASGWTSIGAAVVSVGAALMALLMAVLRK